MNEENKEESCLDNLKKEYNKFKEKYKLPEFLELNKIFDIEEVETDTDFLLRKIRRVISDKTAGYLRFVEIILNPANAPMFFFKLIKKLDEEDKKKLTELHEILGNFEIKIISLDLEYNEEKEAEAIKEILNVFNNKIRIELLKIIKKFSNGDSVSKDKETGSYFG